VIESNGGGQTNLCGTNAASSFHDKSFAGKDIFGKGCIMRIEKWHIKWLKRTA
jgi:hypothetical protein